jgi:diguanylate cyclase (GGDEF)-like protein
LDAGETGRDISFCGHAILHESALVVPDALQDLRFADNPLVTGPPHVRFYAGHPVCAPDGSRVGTVCIIDRKPREFAAADVATLADLAGMVSRELSLSQLATVDELTQLCNCRGLLAAANKCLAHCKRAAQSASLAIIDLDGFKAINDTYGHAAGDQVLREFAALLLKHFRLSDVVARLSGDEFCVLASGATEESLAIAFVRFTDSYARSRLARAYPGLTWSVGVAEFSASINEPLNRLLQIADLRMYEAKSQVQAGS